MAKCSDPDLRDSLLNWWCKGPFMEGYWMKVDYEIHYETHSGWDSDGYDYKSEYQITTYKFRIPESLDINESYANSNKLFELFIFDDRDRELLAVRIGHRGIYTDLYRNRIWLRNKKEAEQRVKKKVHLTDESESTESSEEEI